MMTRIAPFLLPVLALGMAASVAVVPRRYVVELAALVRGTPDGSENRNGYRDDTFTRSAGARVLPVSGDFGMKPYSLPPGERRGPLYLDMRRATFTVSNSRNRNPTPAQPCELGDLPINKVPLTVLGTPGTTVAGALIRGEVPQESDWRATYCNSAAIIFRDSPNPMVDGVRISRAWDGIRIGRASGNFTISNSWLSDVRDDAVENDHLLGGRIDDSLFDGVLQGVSVRPNAKSGIGPSEAMIELSGSLFRLREFRSADGRWRMGSLVKNDPRAPQIRIENTVVALDGGNATRWSDSWQPTWTKLAGGSNNVILWLSDRPMPSGLGLPPNSFRLMTGREARAVWAAAKRNWIDCHPSVRRVAGDPASSFDRCRPNRWGGY